MEARCGNTNLSCHHWELTQEDCQDQDEKHECLRRTQSELKTKTQIPCFADPDRVPCNTS